MSILLAWNTYIVGGLTVLFLVVCVMMMLTVLIQRPQGGGLAGAFGSGAGSGQTAFGAKTGDALTIFTIIVFVLFIAFGMTLNYGYRPDAAAANPPQKQAAPGESAPSPGTTPPPAPAPVTVTPVTPPTPADTPVPADVKPAEPKPGEPAPAPAEPTVPK